jgi:hypothetical protein
MLATLYKTDGTSQEITPGNGSTFTWDEMRNLLCCSMLEPIDAGDPSMVMIGDEEARCKDEFVINQKATQIFRDGNGITDPRATFEANMKAMKEMYGDGFIFMGDPDEEPYTIAGDILYIPQVMLKN